MKRVLIPGVILCGADVAQAVDDKNMYMHFFEEMTVYAPVPVPVNGNTHYTSESIERLPTGNGNISDLLRTNPAVRMDSTQSTSLNQGDIRPEKISIHGASPYQNAYLIDGISATNNLNPANESDASSATNISGMSQGYYLDVSLLDNVTLYDSFVPVEFGRFNGGVIDAKIKRFNADDSKVKLGYRTTRSDWLTSHIDENNKSAFNQGSSGSTYYSPDFKKNFYTLSFNQELADNFGVTAGLSRRQSDITRADYVSNDGIVAGRAQYKNVIDTALSKFTWFASDRFTHDLTLKYTGSSRDYNTSTFPQSDREMGNKSYGLAWDMDTQLAWAKLRTTVGWDHISDYTRHDLCLSSVGGLSIAMVIPGNEINLSAGVMQTFTVLMSHVAPEIEWTVRVISALLLLGVLAEIASWIVGPSRGMYVTAQKNLLPAAFAKMNKNGVPVTLVISQLVITSIALIILTNTGGGNNMSFLIALALTVVIYLCAYFMLFIGYIVLVLKHPDLKRTFNIPGGKGVKLVVAIVGLLTSIMAFIVSFLPPDNIQGDSTDMYVELLVVSFLVVLALPFILYAVHDRKGKANTGVTLEPINSQNAPKGHFFLHPRARSPHYIVMNDKKH